MACTDVQNDYHPSILRRSDLLLHIFSQYTTLRVAIINDFQSYMWDSSDCLGS